MILKTIPTVRVRLILSLVIFLLAFGVRVLTWHDTRLEVGKIQTSVVADYQRVANLIRDGGIRSFFSSSSPLADLNNLGHPPGYPVLLAGVYSIGGSSDTAVQMCQIAADALTAVLLFLIVAELLPLSAGLVAGLLAAFSPQLAWNSVLLLPDSISVLPVLLAVYVLTRAVKNPRLLSFIVVGALIGVSCWLRANVMLLTVFVAAAVPLLVTARRWQLALAVICGTLLIVLPLTIRNAIVFHRFIPLSLGAGQTLLEGIADYDKGGRFGIPGTDMGIMKQEAEIYQRPDYYGTLFNPDGVERERARLSRGFAVISSHPIWFAGVMGKRASSMLRLERSRLLSTDPAITRLIQDPDLMQPDSYQTPGRLLTEGSLLSSQTQASLTPDTQWLSLTGDESDYADQFSAPVGKVRRNIDYLVVVPVKMATGRVRVTARTAAREVYSSAIVEAVESVAPEDQPIQQIRLTFVGQTLEPLKIVVSNEASKPPHPMARVGPISLFPLGPSRFLWTRYPRFFIHAIQKMFITAVMLPLAIIGVLILIFRKQRMSLVILSIVPIYFFTVQSMVHTEYRYVLAVTYFLFGLAGVTVGCGVQLIVKQIGRLTRRSSSAKASVPSA